MNESNEQVEMERINQNNNVNYNPYHIIFIYKYNPENPPETFLERITSKDVLSISSDFFPSIIVVN